MKDVLRERARALATASPDRGRAEETLEVVRFDLANEKYAIELAWIGEVRPLAGLTPLPGTPRFVRGAINIRGRIVCLVDLKAVLGHAEADSVVSSTVVVLRAGGADLGLLVDEIQGVERVPVASLQTSLPALTHERTTYLIGVTPDGVAVLDGGRILSAPELVVQGEMATQ